MRGGFAIVRAAIVLACLSLSHPVFAARTILLEDPEKPDAKIYSLPIDVRGLPAQAEFVPVSLAVDFSQLLVSQSIASIVDERTIWLYRISNRTETEVPVQFTASPQPRPKERKLLPDTPASVSYVNEFAPKETPPGVKVQGQLSWIVRKPGKSPCRYRLQFAIPQSGRFIQVPFLPQNLRAFDREGQATPVVSFPIMQIRPQWPMDGIVQVFDSAKLVTSVHTGPVLGETNASPFRRPFLYPLNGPDGIGLTDFGKPHDPTGSHAHHYSLWIAHANVDEKDFWSEKGGIIAHDGFELLEDGPVFCRVVQKTRWMMTDKDLVHEKRQFTFYLVSKAFRIIDLELTLTPAGSEPITFGKTSFGFFAARVTQSMTVFDGGGEIRNANGELNERGAHLKRAPWLDQSGPIAPSKWGGIAIFDHPENPNYPTGWHCRNDGWAGAAFNMDGPYKVEPGTPLRLRYRIFLHRGNAKDGQVGAHYGEFIARPEITLGQLIVEKGK